MRKSYLRNKVMSDLGVAEYREVGKVKHIRPVPRADINIKDKTPMMRYLELVHGVPIEKLLLAGSLSVVAKKLNTDPSTISKWIKKLRLRYSKDNLPACDRCIRRGPACDSGICYILIELEEYELLELKCKSMFE